MVTTISVVTFLLAGCASTTPSSASGPAVAGAHDDWSVEFDEARAEASVYERGILADDRITNAELADAHARVRRCVRDGGFTIEWSDDGGYEMAPVGGGDITPSVDARLEQVRLDCLDRWDHSVSRLFSEVRRNPQKEDEAKIAVACMRASGLVGKDYTERAWRADNETGDWPFDEYDQRAVQCRLDPLGLWREP